jgi:hypothetical protein
VEAVNDGTPDRHSADPAALEDPVHHDVAEHELHEEEPGPAEPGPGPAGEDEPGPTRGEAPALPSTGDERADAAIARLGETAQSPPAEHPAIYEDVHRRLQDTLADLDGS